MARTASFSELRSFIDELEFSRRFSINFFHEAASLTDFDPKGVGTDKWDYNCQYAFVQLKTLLLIHP